MHERVLTLAWEKQSESNATWALTVNGPFTTSLVVGAGGYFAPHIRAYMRRSGAPDHIGTLVAVKDRQNALKNPYAHLKIPGISREMVESTPMLWEPIRYLETCPSSDGACAMVLASEDAAKKAPHPPAWVHGTAMRSEPMQFAGRDTVSPQGGKDAAADVYRQAASPTRGTSSTAPRCTSRSPGTSRCGWRTSGSAATTRAGSSPGRRDGAGRRHPVERPGGVLSSNPIGASGMIRFAEAALQVRGRAGEHQVDGARRALGHAYGGGAQFFAMWIVGSDRP